MSTDLSQFEKASDMPVDAVAEVRRCLPGTAQEIASMLHQPTAFVIETLDAMRRVGIVTASDGDPPVWRIRHRLSRYCASSGQA